MPSAGFEPTIPVSELPQTHVLDRVATGIGVNEILFEIHYTGDEIHTLDRISTSRPQHVTKKTGTVIQSDMARKIIS
jgi:hypothetical protein